MARPPSVRVRIAYSNPMKIKIPAGVLPFRFQTCLGEVEIIIASGGFIGPGLLLTCATAFARPVDPASPHRPIQVSALKSSEGDVLSELLTGFELPCVVSPNDDFLTAVVDALVEDERVAIEAFRWTA